MRKRKKYTIRIECTAKKIDWADKNSDYFFFLSLCRISGSDRRSCWMIASFKTIWFCNSYNGQSPFMQLQIYNYIQYMHFDELFFSRFLNWNRRINIYSTRICVYCSASIAPVNWRPKDKRKTHLSHVLTCMCNSKCRIIYLNYTLCRRLQRTLHQNRKEETKNKRIRRLSRLTHGNSFNRVEIKDEFHVLLVSGLRD